MPAYPGLPAVSEAGLPGVEVDLWLAVFVPNATPTNIVNRLNVELKKALDNPDTKAALAKVGVEPRGTSPEEGVEFIRREFEQWRKVIAEAKIKPE